jgi:hypothetical protein
MSWENYGSVLENGSLFASSQRGSFDESNKQMDSLEYEPTKERKNGSQGLLKADADHHGSLLYTLLCWNSLYQYLCGARVYAIRLERSGASLTETLVKCASPPTLPRVGIDF